jgi:hypothetical protein
MKKLKKIVIYLLLFIAAFWFVFALLSGAEEYGGGLQGLIKNSPNALPWLILLIFVFVAWKWSLAGGIIIIGLGIASIFMFGIELFGVLAISFPLIILGGTLIWTSKNS